MGLADLLDDGEVAFVVDLTQERLDEVESVLKDGETRIEVDGPRAGQPYLKAIGDEDRAVYEEAAATARSVLEKLRPH